MKRDSSPTSTPRSRWLSRLPELRWPSRAGRRPPADPVAGLFRRIRRDLTALYVSILAATLLIAGAALYILTSQATLAGPRRQLDHSAQEMAAAWAQSGFAPCGTIGAAPPLQAPLFAAYTPQGRTLCVGPEAQGQPAPGLSSNEIASISAFYANPPITGALRSGVAIDQVTGSGDAGTLWREARVAQGEDGRVLGVVMVAVPIGGQVSALHTMLAALIAIGAVTLVGAAVGGFALSARALHPAHIGYQRQQRFIADVSHELRTPLTLVRADAETLLRGSQRFAQDDVELLQDIVSETDRLARLTSDLLILARLDAGAAHVEQDIVDLADVARQVVQRTTALASQRDVSVRLAPSEGDSPPLVLASTDLLDRAALILVDNAIAYNRPGGEIIVTAGRRGAQAFLAVRDTGPGIPPEHLARLGERFYRPEKSRSRGGRPTQGAGLGLSIARGVAETAGGSLSLASSVGSGTTATLTLPAIDARSTSTDTGTDTETDTDATRA